MQYNGSGIVAMSGKNCIAIAADMRYGIQQTTIATNMRKVFKMQDKLYIGISGLATDMQTLYQKLVYRLKLYTLREDRAIKPNVFANMVSGMLYEHRFGPYFTEPVVAGLDEKNEPFLCAMDLIGAPVYTKDFVVAGTSSEELYGVCEALYRPDMEPEDLFETISQCLMAAVDRDCLAGWGALVHVITPDGVTTRTLKSRQD